jgi:hypothetical protein
MANMLNEFQKRALSSTLCTFEEMIREIESKLSHSLYRGILYEELIEESTLKNKKEIANKISFARDALDKLQKQFGLEKRIVEIKRQVIGKLYYCLQIIEAAKAKKLKGYGAVADDLENNLDPQINEINRVIRELIKVIES